MCGLAGLGSVNSWEESKQFKNVQNPQNLNYDSRRTTKNNVDVQHASAILPRIYFKISVDPITSQERAQNCCRSRRHCWKF